MNFTFRIIDSLSHEKTFYSPFALVFELHSSECDFHLAVKLYFPFSFGKTNYLFKIICPLLFVSTQIFLLFDCQRSCATSVGWLSTHVPSCDVRGFLLTSPSVGWSHCDLVGLDGLEPSTSRLSGARSSHLSYKPELTHRL